MPRKKHHILKEGTINALVTVVATAVILIIARWFLSFNLKILTPLQDALDNYQLTDLYFNIHRSSAKTNSQKAVGSDIVIIDISDCRTRTEIADLLDKVAQGEPRVVGLDIIFPDVSSIEQSENEHLLSSLKALPQLVIAKNMYASSDTSFSAERSFFADELIATEGIVNLEYGIVRHFSPLQVFNNDTMPSWTKAIADLAGLEMPSTTDKILIDYSLPDGMMLSAKEAWDEKYLKDKIVLIGDNHDLRDFFTMPISLYGEKRVSGLIIHQKILATISQGHLFKQTPKAVEIIVSIIIIIIATLLSRFLHHKNKDKKWMPDVAFVTLLYLVQLIFIIPTIFMAYCLMWNFYILFSVKYLIVGFNLIEITGKWIDDMKDRLQPNKGNF